MNTQEAITARRSTRAYLPDQVGEEQLVTIMEAVYSAPVAGGRHDAMELAVIQDEGVLDEISDTLRESMGMKADPLYGAPTMLIVSGGEPLDDNALYASTGAILENAQVSAVDLGLASCIIWGTGFGLSDNEGLMERLSISNGRRPLAGLVVGKPAKAPARREAKETYKTSWIR